MIPLADYTVVPLGSTLFDAVVALEHAQQHLMPGKQSHRAVLVTDQDGHIVGKVGPFALMKALEPKYSILGDLETVRRPGIDSQTLQAMMEHLSCSTTHSRTIAGRQPGSRSIGSCPPSPRRSTRRPIWPRRYIRLLSGRLYRYWSLKATRSQAYCVCRISLTRYPNA